MSWFTRFTAWLGSFGKQPLTRDVSRLDPSVAGGREIVGADVGQPLKEGSRRKIARDSRLYPKPTPRWYRGQKRAPVMGKDEANRLFAGTLRTTNRRIRDLLADEEQLARLGLPLWRTEADVAAALGITAKRLRYYAIHRDAERTVHYVAFAIPKRSGGERTILAPKRELKAILRTIDAELVSKLPVADPAHGFRKGRSVRTGAEPHVGKAVVIRLDITDFFHQVDAARVRGFLLACGYSFPVAATLATLCTESERQPVDLGDKTMYVPVTPRRCVQGAPTSPGLCNAIAGKLDRRLLGLAKSFGFAYTRYADDLTFSGDDTDKVHRLIGAVARIAREEGFPLNAKKTRIARKGGPQTVTGVTVNDVLGLSRRQRRKLRAKIHHVNVGRAEDDGTIDGMLAWVQMLNPAQAAALRRHRKARS